MSRKEEGIKGRETDWAQNYERMEDVLSKALLYGVVASTAIVMLGLVLMAVTSSSGYGCDATGDALSCFLSYNPFAIPHGDYPTTFSSLAQGLIQLKPFAVIQLGVIVLIATPALRVFTSLILFGIEKDRAFVLITLVVFAVLLFSFFVVPLIPIFKA